METKFLSDGRKVVVVGALNNQETIVQEVFVTQQGDEIVRFLKQHQWDSALFHNINRYRHLYHSVTYSKRIANITYPLTISPIPFTVYASSKKGLFYGNRKRVECRSNA
ncbi:hypothetical protein HV097_09595 [Enterobacter roggenkampii]|uniref:hypothetical protein n=1 Tax=Enterobacter roggenkampii TaxID=1812935 RepID=UPI0015EA85B5|nr:hypothetical protein [Enterobacter roggenkampii]QMR79257.1 hypothetical protein HV097_09595 [Enterobacter roggenkampii]